MYKNLQQFISVLEKENELIRIREFVDPVLEIPEVVDRISKAAPPSFPTSGTGHVAKEQGMNQNKALLFENTGTGFPMLINAFGSERRMCLALGVNHLDDIAGEIESLFKYFMKPKDNVLDKLMMLPKLGKISSWMPKIITGRGACQEVVMEHPDINRLPVLKCWTEDGGRFLTLPIIHTKDPNSGIRNVGLYRMQVFEPTLTGMHWHKHKVSAGHFNEYKKLKQRMPVAVALGGDPVYTYAATAPLPPNVDEYMLAGFIRKKKVDLVKCLTIDAHVPADADIIIEGYIDPEEEFILEGPFGDHTGYYSLADYYPKFHITCITHRKNAIYPATIVGIPPQEDAWMGKATERIFLAPIKMTLLPEVKDMDLPIDGVFHNLTIMKIENEFEGQAQKVMNAMWGAGQMMFNKILVIADGDVNIHNYWELAKYVSENVEPTYDIYFSSGPMDVLDHSCSKFAFGGKICIDATKKVIKEGGQGKRENSSSFIPSLSTLFPEIKAVNFSLLEKNISVVIISVEKKRKNQVKELNEKIFSLPGFQSVKMIIYVEESVDVNDLQLVLWRFSNNIDPKRDCFIIENHIGIDGTRKTKELDNFDRDWPNIICMDEATIKSVDEKWSKIFPPNFPFIKSPSLKYRKMLYKGGAVVEE